MLDWTGYRQELLKRIGDLGRLTPVPRAYRELSQAGVQTAHLDAKTRELIAIAVGVTRQCDGCITTHVHAARQQGATAEEVAETLGVAIAVNAGAALVFGAGNGCVHQRGAANDRGVTRDSALVTAPRAAVRLPETVGRRPRPPTSPTLDRGTWSNWRSGEQVALRSQVAHAREHQAAVALTIEVEAAKGDGDATGALIDGDDRICRQRHAPAWQQDERSRRTVASDRQI